jgi:hypothetical protein
VLLDRASYALRPEVTACGSKYYSVLVHLHLDDCVIQYQLSSCVPGQ